KHRSTHAHPVMHPASSPHLPHTSIDNRNPGLSLLPGSQIIGCIAPLDFIGIFLKRPMSGYTGKIKQGMQIKLAPEQFIQPGLLTDIINLEITVLKQDLHTLTDRENTDIQIW